MPSYNPSADFCFGRDSLVESIYRSALQHKSVLLFGGRQSGKTTILLRLEKLQTKVEADVERLLSEIVLPVYVQLAGVGELLTPKSFFAHLSKQAVSKCNRTFANVDLQFENLPSQSKLMTGLDGFQADWDSISKALKPKQVEFLFLIDEAGRLNRLEQKTAVKDNLFSILYGERNLPCYMVFAGAQDIYEFTADDGASPIGARAKPVKIHGLNVDAVQTLVSKTLIDLDSENASRLSLTLHNLTGGHAGLSASIARDLSIRGMKDLNETTEIGYYIDMHQMLFRVWREHLSSAALVVHDRIVWEDNYALEKIHSELAKLGFRLNAREQALDEMEFTGLGIIVGTNPSRKLQIVNLLYAIATKPSLVKHSDEQTSTSGRSLSDRIRSLVDTMMSEIKNINTDFKNKNPNTSYHFVFEPDNRHHEIYQDLVYVCESREDFSDFCASLYLQVFETTSDFDGKNQKRTRQLERLPTGYRKEEQIIRFIDALRHDFGKGHLTERANFTVPANSVTSADVLTHYLGSATSPDESEYVVLQERLLVDFVDYLRRLKPNI